MNAPNNQEGTALTVASRQQFDLSPQTFEQALTFSEYLAASDMVPKAYRGKPGDCLIAMQWGYEVGLKPLQALQSIATINGKPGVFGDAGKAILLAAGCIIEEDDIAIVEKNTRARCKITRPGRPPVERTFSLENAKTAGLWNKEGPWRSYPWRQMAWRAFWFAARDAASDLLRGLPGVEEVVDMTATPTERHMGPAEVVPAAPPATYDAGAFTKNLPAWRKLIESGKKTVTDVISTIETKAPLSEEQKAEIRAIKPAQQPADGNEPQDVAPKVTYAQVAEKLNAAQDTEQLAIAATLIAVVAEEKHRAELTALYEQRGAELPF
jgi:hypothetical protein